MSTRMLIVAAAVAALAACDKSPDTDARSKSKADPSSATTGASQVPTTPANLPKPATQEEKREGANPVQGQVDPKEREQHKDFQQKGDAAGPTGPSTTPRQ